MPTTYTLHATAAERDLRSLDRRLAASPAYEKVLVGIACERLASDFIPIDPESAAAWLAQHGVSCGREAQLVEAGGRTFFAAYDQGEGGHPEGLRAWDVQAAEEVTTDQLLDQIESAL